MEFIGLWITVSGSLYGPCTHTLYGYRGDHRYIRICPSCNGPATDAYRGSHWIATARDWHKTLLSDEHVSCRGSHSSLSKRPIMSTCCTFRTFLTVSLHLYQLHSRFTEYSGFEQLKGEGKRGVAVSCSFTEKKRKKKGYSIQRRKKQSR